MDCEREEVERGAASTSSFTEDQTQFHSGPSVTTSQCSESSEEKDLESVRAHPKDSELSPTDELSEKENSCLISPLGKSKPLAFDVHIKEVPANGKASFQDVLSTPGISNIGDAFPVCVQLPANHLQKGHMSPYNTNHINPYSTNHINPYKTSHGHRRISRCSSSLSLRAPVEDLCASLLLACLFCRFWECVLALGEGCQVCVASLCSSLCSRVCVCCCEPSALELLLELSPCCGCVELLEACGCSWGENTLDCCACDLCLQTSECLELGMELSQMLFH